MHGALTTQQAGAARIVAPAKLLRTNRVAFRAEVLERIPLGACEAVIVFNETTEVDMAGLGLLVSLRSLLHANGITLVLEGLNAGLHNLLIAAKLDTLFIIRAATRSEAQP